MIKILFHLFATLQFAYGCYYDHAYVRIPSSSSTTTPFAGKLKYLTNLDSMIQTAYFAIALINDLFGNNEPTPSEKPFIRRLKDKLFSSLAFPVALFVGITFWSIYAIDRELILPRSLDPYFPTWLNHVMHTNIVLFMLIELVSSFRMYPSNKHGLSILCSFMLSYMVWIHFIYFKTGSWVYPILNVLNWPLRIVFYLFSLGLVCGLYALGNFMNSTVWYNEVKQTVRSGKKKAK